MKRQYLGDSKDSFKWDYHDYLVEALAYDHLKIAWMMTPDDGGTHGASAPELFPARPEILRFCNRLRSTRDPALVLGLPAIMGAKYRVSFHDPDENKNDANHRSWFSGILPGSGQVIFLDPDNGFEPERCGTDKHVRYADLDGLIKLAPSDTVFSVFQHHRRKKFPDDFARIRKRLLSGYATAIYWHSLMFVNVASSRKTIRQVEKINREYAKHRPVKALA